MKYFVSYFAQVSNGGFTIGSCVMESTRRIETENDIAQLRDSILESINQDGMITAVTIINYKEM